LTPHRERGQAIDPCAEKMYTFVSCKRKEFVSWREKIKALSL
jgi:hypothetical protein